MNKKSLLFLIVLFANFGISAQKVSPVDLVNPYMGTISHLLVPTHPTVHLPNSFLRIYPNRMGFNEDLIKGLPVVVPCHRAGTAFTINPFQGNLNDLHAVPKYSYDQEKITPYSYSVYLDEQQIEVNFGVSHQSAIYEFKYEKEGKCYLSLNSKNGKLIWDGEAIKGYEILKKNNKFGTNGDGVVKAFIYLKPAIQPEKIHVLNNKSISEGTKSEGQNIGMILQFSEKENNLICEYGISFIDEKQAQNNLQRELINKNIDQLHKEGREIWNKALNKIQVRGGTIEDQIVFYTSLYRCFERPVCFSEDGRYFSPYDYKVHNDQGRPNYTDDWVWDTYQVHHPLRVLIDKKKEEDILHSYITMTDQMENAWMPTFPSITGDMRGMDSNHGVACVIDAYRKGLHNFDLEKAYKVCKAGITEKTLSPWSGKPAGELEEFYKKHGYIPEFWPGQKETVPSVNPGERRQSVTVTLGTSFDEWCLSQIAHELGKTDDYEYFLNHSLGYRNLYNPETGFFHPKDKDGNFIHPVDYKMPGEPGARGYYGENNAWVYSFDVKHNLPDLIKIMGGKTAFASRLDQMFAEPLGISKYRFYAKMPDDTGNVGMFSMGNEPTFHIPYLYNYADQPWKTQKRIRSLLRQWFRNDLMGVPGDEDGGGMSAFVVFSLVGIYPITPGLPEYTIGSPAFEKTKINLDNGKFLVIEAKNLSEDNKYIQSATLNGKPLNIAWIKHSDISEGGKIVFEMGEKANREWGVKQ